MRTVMNYVICTRPSISRSFQKVNNHSSGGMILLIDPGTWVRAAEQPQRLGAAATHQMHFRRRARAWRSPFRAAAK